MLVYIVLHRQSATNVTSNFAQFMESLKGGGYNISKERNRAQPCEDVPDLDTAP